MRAALLATALSSAALCLPARAHASPEDLFGFGPRTIAMGGLGATFVDDYAAVHANPASLSRARVRSFSLGYQGTVFDLSVQRGSGPREHASIERARATTIGLTLPLPFGGVLTDRLALGFGFYTPTDVVVRGRILRPETPQFLVVADRAQTVALQMGLGVDLGYGLRVGAGFAALAAITGSVLIATEASGRVGSRVDNQLVASYAPVFGASFDTGPFRVALVFRGILEGRFAVSIEARDIGLPLPVFNIAGIAQYDPWQIALEGGFVRGPWTLAVGATFKRWSEYPGPLEATTSRSPAPPAPGFHDTLVLRAGAEHRWNFGTSQVALRGGYFYEPTPSPDAIGMANYLDNDRHVGTLGLALSGQAAGTTLTVEPFFQAHWLPTRVTVKGENVPEDNPGAPSIAHGGAFYVAGVTGTVTF
jgi:long-chain fatty acid transport protein